MQVRSPYLILDSILANSSELGAGVWLSVRSELATWLPFEDNSVRIRHFCEKADHVGLGLFDLKFDPLTDLASGGRALSLVVSNLRADVSSKLIQNGLVIENAVDHFYLHCLVSDPNRCTVGPSSVFFLLNFIL